MEESSPCSWGRERVRKADPVFIDHQIIISPPFYLDPLHFILISIFRSISHAHSFLLLLFHAFATVHFSLNSPASLFSCSVLSCTFYSSSFIFNPCHCQFISFILILKSICYYFPCLCTETRKNDYRSRTQMTNIATLVEPECNQ